MEDGAPAGENAAPEVQSLTLESSGSTTPFNTLSTLEVSSVLDDGDGDALTAKVVWFLNGKPILGESGETLDGSLFEKGDTITAQVMALDGNHYSSPVATDVTIVNTVPDSPEIAILPQWALAAHDTAYDGTLFATEMEPLLAEVSTVPEDLDPDFLEGTDGLQPEYEWFLDGAPETVFSTDATLDPSFTALVRPGWFPFASPMARASVIRSSAPSPLWQVDRPAWVPSMCSMANPNPPL